MSLLPDKEGQHPRALLLFTKIAVVGFAASLAVGHSWPYVGLHRWLLAFALGALHPRFGWLVPMTLVGVLIGVALPFPGRANWDPSDDFGWISSLVVFGFIVGFVAERMAQRE
jgi:hypothetical protein